MKPVIAKTIDEYIAGFPEATQKLLNKVRSTMRKAIPKAEETISYGIPTFKLNGRYVVYFAGYKNHISVYPAPRENPEFKKELSAYKGGKGTVQFPLDEPLPLELITRITRFRLQINKEAGSTKK
jgi:uncharacterized protein YdhG (YjbR/CyaY superfamily)